MEALQKPIQVVSIHFASGDFVILNNENSCRVYSLSGKERFAGEFDFSVAQVTRGRAFNSLIISGGDRMREIRLK